MDMKTTGLTGNIQKDITAVKKILSAEDVLTFSFSTQNDVECALIYADGMVNKQLLGELVARPLSALTVQKAGGKVELNALQEQIQTTVRFPEFKTKPTLKEGVQEVLDGNTLLLIDTLPVAFIVGAKLLPVRAVMEPPTDVAVKGPREGFIEDIKTNMALVRKRLKTPELQMDTLRLGKRSDTAVVVCYLQGTTNPRFVDEVKQKLQKVELDNVPSSSYVSAMLSSRPNTVFRTVGTTEKPDIFTAKIAEGRVGVLVDGSPIALTAPFILTEDLQSSEDYFISPFMATLFRLLRLIALFVAVLLPAFYVSAQLFKMQLLPLGLILTVASSVRELPLSPALEMFVVLFLLETLKEASIRMPKYVGMSLSVVGALVLGETAVSAGFLSTPAIIVVAFSGICLYTVPNFVETGSLLRWLYLLVAGGLGTFGIVLLSTFLLCYLFTLENFSVPVLAPFSPLRLTDMKDTVVKYDLFGLKQRPTLLHSPNKTRLKKGD